MKITKKIADAIVSEFLAKYTHEMTEGERLDFIEKIHKQLKVEYYVGHFKHIEKQRNAKK